MVCTLFSGMGEPTVVASTSRVQVASEAETPVDVSADEQTSNRRKRVIKVAVLVGVVIALLAVLFGYLRLDHATRGFYSGKLQTLAAIEVLLILGLAYYLYVQLTL